MKHFLKTNTGAYFTIVVVMVLASASVASSKAFEPIYQPELEMSKVPKSIDIDGDLTDAGWQSAGRADNFVERSPGDNTQPVVSTEALITYDNDKLYVAFICHDDPESLRATMCQRDQFDADDAIGILIDTYGEASWAYQFFVNPYGIQKDRLWTSVHGEDAGFDLIWESAARITDSGYQVEMAIPFASMRFPNQEAQSWKVDFWRNRPRESYFQYTWSANNRDEQCWPCQWGKVDGITGVRPGKGFEILATVTGNKAGTLDDSSDRNSSFSNGSTESEVSLGGKYSFTSDITGEATYNPDFSQIEADAAQIDINSTIALLFPERRPFFQEGSDVFRTLFNAFYTRMVLDPEYAGKFTARMDKTSVGYFLARDENSPYMIPLGESGPRAIIGRSTVNVLRGMRSIGNDTQLGFMVTDRRYDGGGSGTILAVDGDIRLTRNYSVDGQFIYALTEEPNDPTIMEQTLSGRTFDDGKYTAALDGESYNGTGVIARLRRQGRHFNFNAGYDHTSPTYRTQTGYDPWNDYRNFSTFVSYAFLPQSGFFERITPQASTYNRWTFDGDTKWENMSAGLSGRLRWAQTFTAINYTKSDEIWYGINFNKLWNLNFDWHSRPHSAIGYGISASTGEAVAHTTEERGNEKSLNTYLDFKPIDRLMIEPTFDWLKSTNAETGEELYRQYVIRSRIRFQVNRELSLRLVVQYSDSKGVFTYEDQRIPFGDRGWDIDPLLTYRINSFSVFYLGSTQHHKYFDETLGASSRWRMSDRKFFLKLQYLFQV